MNDSLQIFSILVGTALLLFGRRLYWVFVAGVGFVVGARLAVESLGASAGAGTVWVALAIGLIGAILSLVLQRVLVGIAGFLAGGYLLYTATLGLGHNSWGWIAFVLGGILGTVLLLGVFDWALIALSALMGAAVIAQNVPLDPVLSSLVFLVLMAIGIVVQARQLVPKVEKQET